MTTTKLVYIYDSRLLLITYGVAFAVALLLALVGALSGWDNGCFADFRFSTIVRTTRDPRLADLVRGAELGSNPLPERIARRRLRFGLSADGGRASSGIPTFGNEGEVLGLVRGADLGGF